MPLVEAEVEAEADVETAPEAEVDVMELLQDTLQEMMP